MTSKIQTVDPASEAIELVDVRIANSCSDPSLVTRHSSLSGSHSDPSLVTRHSSLSLLRLCQLVSPALPVGAYHFSQGLEYAAHAGWVSNEQDTTEWIGGIARRALGTLDVPLLLRMHAAWEANDEASVERWSRYLIAARETAELRAEERHMGKALAKVLVELDIESARPWIVKEYTAYAGMFALAATRWQIDRVAAAQAYVWAWAENQVLAALKLLPIGQSAGQRMLNRIVPFIPELVTKAIFIDDESIAIGTPSHGIASSRHETQYSRLFRS